MIFGQNRYQYLVLNYSLTLGINDIISSFTQEKDDDICNQSVNVFILTLLQYFHVMKDSRFDLYDTGMFYCNKDNNAVSGVNLFVKDSDIAAFFKDDVEHHRNKIRRFIITSKSLFLEIKDDLSDFQDVHLILLNGDETIDAIKLLQLNQSPFSYSHLSQFDIKSTSLVFVYKYHLI